MIRTSCLQFVLLPTDLLPLPVELLARQPFEWDSVHKFVITVPRLLLVPVEQFLERSEVTPMKKVHLLLRRRVHLNSLRGVMSHAPYGSVKRFALSFFMHHSWRDRGNGRLSNTLDSPNEYMGTSAPPSLMAIRTNPLCLESVSYTHLRAHETPEHLVCRLLLEKKKITRQ
eukprot:TRINITY_DN12058_c0_g1_i1.p1 TRINITY_DN12058_c0_g1~~TRINITY_DN12058_c0_g1_i1.p1  ORF type:complete len:171 (+),score=14.73 TRINITY_DN12058_c0_g1_i1:526-1038(+)